MDLIPGGEDGKVGGHERLEEGWSLSCPRSAAYTHGDLSLSSVNRELVRKASGKSHLVVHSSMEPDVGLLRLYPGIPASLVGKP